MSTAGAFHGEARQLTDAALTALLHSVPAFIIAIDLTGHIRFINQVLPQYTREEVIGSHWLRYIAPHEHAEQQARFEKVLRTGVTEHYETTIAGPNGQSLRFSSHVGVMRLEDQIVGAILVSQDVTELKRTQAEYAAAQRLAAIGTLAAGIAHEINTPIQFVSDYLLGLWGLPLTVVEAVANHHRPETFGSSELLVALHVADALVHETGGTRDDPSAGGLLQVEAVAASPWGSKLAKWRAYAEAEQSRAA